MCCLCLTITENTINEDFLFEFFINVIKYLLLIDQKLTERTIIFIFKLLLIIFIYFVILKTIVFAVIHTFCFIFWLTLYKSSWGQRQICQIEMSCLHGFKDKLLFFPWIVLFLSNIIGFSHLNSVFQRAYEIVQSSKYP